MKRRSISALQKTKFITYKKKSSHSFLNEFFDGISRFFPSHSRNYLHPTGGGFYADAIAMRRDFSNIANDMRKAIRKYEQTKAS